MQTRRSGILRVCAFIKQAAVIAGAVLAAGPLTAASAQQAAEPLAPKHHALSLISTPKYPPDFKHFDYVNPQAPKGGEARLGVFGFYDNFNILTFKGRHASGLGLMYDSLMEDSLEEPSTSYGLLAEWVSYPKDFSSATFKLREEARWHDGKPVTVEDVIFSLNAFKKGDPAYAFYYKNVIDVKKTGPREVTFYFDVKGNRELPMIIGQLSILPKHYWTGKDKDGKPRDISATTMTPPLGSGPYRIVKTNPGKSVVFERVKDYWARDLPVQRGKHNFDRIRYDYYRDNQVLFEAFKAGELDFMNENNSKRWGTAYNFQAVKDGRVIVRTINHIRGAGMQGFIFNLRRAKFADRRVRQAFNLVFDFEWSNKHLFYGQYKRTNSYFANTELAAKGLPQGRELEILNEVRDLVPEEVFTKEYRNPVFKSPADNRKARRQALKLLAEAGWEIRNNVLTNVKTGEPMQVEFLLVSKAFERIIIPYIQNLKQLGIQATVRVVDSAQYKRRRDNFDFDMIVWTFQQSHSPGNEQREFWGSQAADRKGSRNLIGIKNPAIDKLIDRVIFAKDRAELVAATRALDRVLLWNYYLVPNWHVPYDRIAYWNKFKHPKTLPKLGDGFPTVWWWDAASAAKLAEARKPASEPSWFSQIWQAIKGVF